MIPSGYGSLGNVEVHGRVRSQVGAHRVAFYLTHGYWPHVARHTCDNRPCVNPAHILDGSHQDNTADMIERGRAAWSDLTHCKRGHPFDEENTYDDPAGGRRCKACARDYARERYTPRPARPKEQATHCRHGHEWNETNTGRRPNGSRYCRPCAAAAMRRKVPAKLAHTRP